MAVNWCKGCNGDGYADTLFRKKECPVCHADPKYAFKNAFGKIIGYVQPPETPSPKPEKCVKTPR